MIHDKRRVSRMAEELISDFFRLQSEGMKLTIVEKPDRYIISITGRCRELSKKELKRMRKLLGQPRNRQMEEYFWSLSGDSDVESEYALLGNMSDEIEVDYNEESRVLSITVVRLK